MRLQVIQDSLFFSLGSRPIFRAVPSLMKPKVTIVIFPLLALVLDQVERIRLQGLNVWYFMSDMEEADREIAKRKLQSNPPEYHFLFATPETVLAPGLFRLLQRLSSENFWLLRSHSRYPSLPAPCMKTTGDESNNCRVALR